MPRHLVEKQFDGNGERRYGGRSLRVSGARAMASMGLEIVLFQLMAHWSSQVVSVSEAPVAKISDMFEERAAEQSLRWSIAELTRRISELRTDRD